MSLANDLFNALSTAQKEAYEYTEKRVTLLGDDVAITGILFAEFDDSYYVYAAGFIGEYPKSRWRRV